MLLSDLSEAVRAEWRHLVHRLKRRLGLPTWRSCRDWTEEEWKAHYRAIEAASREVMEELGSMQDDAIRRFGVPAPWTEEELRRLREGYEHGRERMDAADALALGAVLEDWPRHDNDEE